MHILNVDRPRRLSNTILRPSYLYSLEYNRWRVYTVAESFISEVGMAHPWSEFKSSCYIYSSHMNSRLYKLNTQHHNCYLHDKSNSRR